MLPLIQQCHDAKHEKKLSNRDIAEGSGVPLSTVNNFFRSVDRSPCVDTAGPICAYLGISMDAFFGIQPPPAAMSEQPPEPECTAEYLSQQLAVSEAERASAAKQLKLMREMVDKQNHGIRMRDHFLVHLFILVVACLIWAVYLDMHCLDFGFWRG